MEIINKNDHVASHQENRSKICLLCLGKTKVMYKIEGATKKRLLDISSVSDHFLDDKFPNALCSTCRKNVYNATSKNNENAKKAIVLPDLSIFCGESKVTRSNLKKACSCTLCERVRSRKFYCKTPKSLSKLFSLLKYNE